MRTSVIALLACLACAAPAAAAERVTAIAGAPGPGPSKYDKVFVTKFGPGSAKRVLVLMPGYYGGAGDFTLDAREHVRRVPGLQVWSVDRRSEALEDTSRFKDALAGRITAQQALDYYLGWLTNPAQQPHFQPLDQAQFGLPWAAGVFAEVGALVALKEPTAPSAVQSFPLLPPAFKVPRSRSVLVDASSDESHLDPLTAAPARNRFLKTVVPFLRTVH